MYVSTLHAYYGMFWGVYLKCGPAFSLMALRDITENIVQLMRQ